MQSRFMDRAIELAKKAGNLGEVPVGAVIVKDGEIIAEGYNLREQKQNALSHAELEAINNACNALGDWRLDGCTIYVTLEPCPMCAGAIINSRIKKVTFGAYDKKAGSFGSVTDFNSLPYNHKPQIEGGVCERECSEILSRFFKTLRSKK